MAGSILGTRVLRTEDPDLLTGAARYVNDLDLPGKLHAVFARSEVAHATLHDVHTDDALATPGVVAVFTAADLGVAPHHGFAIVHPDFARPPLADGVVRFVGEAIALVVGETLGRGGRRRRRRVGRLRAARRDHRPGGRPRRGRPGDLPRARIEPGDRRRPTPTRSTSTPRQRRDRRARPLRQPAHGRRADGTERLRRDSGDDGRMTFYASNQMPHGLHGQLADAARHRRRPTCT